MSDRTPEAILNDIHTYEQIATKDLDVLPLRLRPSHEIAAREATERLPVLRDEYRQRILANSLGLFTTGGAPGDAEKFAEVAAKEGPLSVDANELYRTLAEKIEPAMGHTREFVLGHLLMLHQEMLRLRLEAGYSPALDLPTLAAVETAPNVAALADYIRKLVVQAGGQTLNGLYVASKMIGSAIDKRFAGKTFAVVVINSSEEDRAHLAPVFSRTNTVDLSGVEAIDRAFAINAFKSARSVKASKNEAVQKGDNQ